MNLTKINLYMVVFKAKGLLTHMLTHGVTDICNKYQWRIQDLTLGGWDPVVSIMRFFTDTFRLTDVHPLSSRANVIARGNEG